MPMTKQFKKINYWNAARSTVIKIAKENFANNSDNIVANFVGRTLDNIDKSADKMFGL